MTRRAFALCGPRRRFLKIDCLLNLPHPGRLEIRTELAGERVQTAFPRTEQKRCCIENTRMFARIDKATEFTPGPQRRRETSA